ncbi:MAG: hypothetical protein ABEK50_11685 [bacterium]
MNFSSENQLPGWSQDVLSKHASKNSDQLSIGIVTYGSLLHPEEVQNLFGLGERDQIKVTVSGYRRCFNKRIADHIYRETGPDKTAVLNVERASSEWFNGLLLGPIQASAFKQYAFREKDYELEALQPDAIEVYPDEEESALAEFNSLYTCLLDNEDARCNSIEPVPSYLDLCLEGALSHGEDFLDDFKRSTYVKESLLVDYLSGP